MKEEKIAPRSKSQRHQGIIRKMPTLPEHLSSSPVFSGGWCYSILSLMCMFCRSLFFLLYFFFWPLYCLSFELRILIIPLVSSNSSYKSDYYTERKGTHFNFHGENLEVLKKNPAVFMLWRNKIPENISKSAQQLCSQCFLDR